MVLLSVMMILVQAGLRGDLSAEIIAIFLVVVVVVLAVLAPSKENKKKGGQLERALFGIGIPVTGLLVFAINSSNGTLQQFVPVISSLLALFVALIGLLIMLRGIFK